MNSWDIRIDLYERMEMINIRSKGANGEREFCRWLQSTLNLNYLPTRNLEQVRSGGADILGLDPFIFEIKRCESLSLREWWAQVSMATMPSEISVVAYRQNRKKWKFLISAKYIGLDKGYIQLDELEFKKWIRNYFIK